ncbi:MAG: aminoglycoside phosphotransferase family protein [Acidimicrobiia bacterium]|nr:aminoglycoside phosphotransferase family protein [Acidimicrobiia bacterium]
MATVGSLVAVGRTSDVYEFGRASVVKVPRPTVPPHWAEREARITAAVRELGAPAPEVRDVVQIDGRDAVVFERVGGTSMWDQVISTPRLARSLARELAEVHKQILRSGIPAGVPGLVDRMSGKIERAEALCPEEREEAQRLVERMPRGAALLHGDLHPANVLMTDRGPVAIDWFDAAIGHPVADVVRSSILVRPFPVADDRPHLPAARREFLDEFHDAYVSSLSEVVSSPPDELRRWEALVAASRLAEGAESDESSLVALWRNRDRAEPSPLLAARSALSLDQ